MNKNKERYKKKAKKIMYNQTIMSQQIYKNGCWTCKRAIEDPQQKYICPKAKQHLIEYQNQE